MKYIIYGFLLCMLTACSKHFLEIYPDTSLNEGNFYTSESEFIILANGCYVPMRNYEKSDHWVIAELISDNGTKQYNSVTGEPYRGIIDQLTLTADNAIYSDFWDLSYNGIARCNKLLYELDRHEISWSDTALKARCAGEALLLRALYYFNLVRQFGGVPLVLQPITSQESVGIKRSEEEAVYESIIGDLNDAILRFSHATQVEEKGRANLEAARALLGKVYLTLHRYTDAISMLEPVIQSGKYSLLPDYAALFNPANKDFKETIFAIQYSENSAELSNRFIFWFAPWNSGGHVTGRPNISVIGGGFNIPTDDLIRAFEPGDKRKEVSVGYWTGTDWDGVVRPLPYCAKYRPPISAPDDRCGDNLPVIRYSDVLLMYAEALNDQGKTSTAIPYVRQVRSRAGLSGTLDGYSQAKLDSLIARERQKEFCFENQRWYDLKRTGKALEVMKAHGERLKQDEPFLPANSYQMTPQKLLAPIPAEQVLLNQITQNPGY
ncbi:RagB/SusD family nutrient uptake outer membrane protein [Compostibacter hankyongensis]|uniref:RagB/SusD family nutrient uptake outer membrane protein n=1 Tax=Compostibacter hankyongensis TaxID=1007089 RepID=A0ABP8G3L3_9BACT